MRGSSVRIRHPAPTFMVKFPRFTLNKKETPKEVLSVNTNPDLIYVFDNVLDENDIKDIQTFNWDWLPWRERDNYSISPGTARFDFYVNNPVDPPFLTYTKVKVVDRIRQTLDPSAELVAVGVEFAIRSTSNDEVSGQSIHRDCQELGSIWSILIHVMGDSGATEFFDNNSDRNLVKSVPFKAGRIVMFPSLYSHRGRLPEQGKRISMNSICKMNFSKTENIFDRSPELKKYLPDMI
jgi:hypothetical protein